MSLDCRIPKCGRKPEYVESTLFTQEWVKRANSPGKDLNQEPSCSETTMLTTPQPHHLISDLMHVSRHLLSLCAPYMITLMLCYTVSPTILQRAAGACLCGNLGKRGNTVLITLARSPLISVTTVP